MHDASYCSAIVVLLSCCPVVRPEVQNSKIPNVVLISIGFGLHIFVSHTVLRAQRRAAPPILA
jgi:hypothetical protein